MNNLAVKLSFNKVKEVVESYNLKLLSSTYNGIGAPIEIVCYEGHKAITTYKNIKKVKGCVECNRLAIFDKFAKLVENTNDGHILITKREEFINTATKLTFSCPNEHTYLLTMSHYREGRRCNYCKGERISRAKRLSLEEVSRRYSERGYEILNVLEDYKNSQSKLIVKCPKGHIYESSVGNFSSGYNCEACFREIQRELIPRGENHSSWKGGISPLKELCRNSIIGWKKRSMEMCKYKCIITGDKFSHIHHLHPFHIIFSSFIDSKGISRSALLSDFTQIELDQLIKEFVKYHDSFGLGVCLSLEVHNLFHHIYGFDGTKEDFEEFKKNYSPSNLDAIYYI